MTDEKKRESETESLKPASMESEIAELKGSVHEAIRHYKNAVFFGKPRNGALEAWFKKFVGEFENDL